MEIALPNEDVAKKIAEDLALGNVVSVQRFGTGMDHYVYDVQFENDRVAIRLTRPDKKNSFRSAMYWYKLLKPEEIPLPTVRESDVDGHRYGFPLIVMDRLPGKDLWHAYREMSRQQKESLAEQIVLIQRTVGNLKSANGFGYAKSYDDPDLYDSWLGVMDHYMKRIMTRNEISELIEERYINQLKYLYGKFAVYFNEVRPIAFLDDTTTKNVIIDQGRLSGIVDVDCVCFGDPLFVLGLTRMSLWDLRVDTEYTDYWMDLLNLQNIQKKALDLYSAMFSLEFISAMGMKFNKDTAMHVDMEALEFRLAMFEELTKDL